MSAGGRPPEPFDPASFDRGSYGAEWSGTLRRGSDAELREWLDLALACCDAADAVALGQFRRDLEIVKKPDMTFVTQVDRAIETLIRDRVRDAYPHHGLVGEEHGEDGADASVRWFIDPIDGTHNYIRGVSLFGTLIGVERDGEMQVGVLSAPALQERWFAWRGGGAWTVGGAGLHGALPRRMRTSALTTLRDAQVLYSSERAIARTGWAPGFPALLDRAWRERGFGDFWGYALVADGSAEAMIEVGVQSWDLAGPLVVVEESGGRLTDFGGRRSIAGASTIASNGPLHGEILAVLAGTG